MRKSWRQYRTEPYVSGGLVAVNIILFLWCTFDGGMLYNIGGLSPHSIIADRQYWRMILSLFLHGDIQHLVNNMLLLFGLGAMIEKETGHLAFGVVYLASGIGGNVASLLYKMGGGQWYVDSIGASGAVFGLIGLLLILTVVGGRRMVHVTPARIILVIAYSIYSNWGNTRIDNAAHVGGVVTGILVGCLLCLWNYQKWKIGGKEG